MEKFIEELEGILGRDILKDVTLFPSNEEELSLIFRLANKYKVALSTEKDAFEEGFQISLDEFDNIIEILEEDFLLISEGGVSLNTCIELLKERKLFYPFKKSDIQLHEAIAKPVSPEFRYYVLGIRVVAPNGDILDFGGKTVKNVTGYNMTGFFVGSREIFGIITKVIIKLTPLPKINYPISKIYNKNFPQILYELKRSIDPNNILNPHILKRV